MRGSSVVVKMVVLPAGGGVQAGGQRHARVRLVDIDDAQQVRALGAEVADFEDDVLGEAAAGCRSSTAARRGCWRGICVACSTSGDADTPSVPAATLVKRGVGIGHALTRTAGWRRCSARRCRTGRNRSRRRSRRGRRSCRCRTDPRPGPGAARSSCTRWLPILIAVGRVLAADDDAVGAAELLPVPAMTLPVVGIDLGRVGRIVECRIEVIQQAVGVGRLAEEGPADAHVDASGAGSL